MNNTHQKHKMISCSLEIDITTPGELLTLRREELSEDLQKKLREVEESFLTLNKLMVDVNAPVDMSLYVMRKEALNSSTMSGIEADLEDLLDESSDTDVLKQTIALEEAYQYAIKSLDRVPLSARLLKDMHSVLMLGEAGNSEFRRHQLYFGGGGLSEAQFIPAAPEDITDLMSDWEQYVHSPDETPELLRLALSYYQLEIIKPFAEGNGRIARAMLLLFLLEKDILRLPLFEISDVLLTHQQRLEEELTLARNSEHFEGWISFFLDMLQEASEGSILSLRQLKFFFEDNPGGKG